MRPVFVGEFGDLEARSLHSAPDSIPSPDDVVVDVKATAANFRRLASDRRKISVSPGSSVRLRSEGLIARRTFFGAT
jgi:hypothetical protein